MFLIPPLFCSCAVSLGVILIAGIVVKQNISGRKEKDPSNVLCFVMKCSAFKIRKLENACTYSIRQRVNNNNNNNNNNTIINNNDTTTNNNVIIIIYNFCIALSSSVRNSLRFTTLSNIV